MAKWRNRPEVEWWSFADFQPMQGLVGGERLFAALPQNCVIARQLSSVLGALDGMSSDAGKVANVNVPGDQRDRGSSEYSVHCFASPLTDSLVLFFGIICTPNS